MRRRTAGTTFGRSSRGEGRRFLLRGLNKETGEWSLVCSAHDLLKLTCRWQGAEHGATVIAGAVTADAVADAGTANAVTVEAVS